METLTRTQRCPVLDPANAALEAAQALHKALRRLRRQAARCTRCRDGLDPSGCARLDELNACLDIAIEAINQEWGLG